MVGERGDQHRREIDGPRLVVLRFGQVDALRLKIEFAQPDRNGLAEAHPGVAERAQEQPVELRATHSS